jgi:hypothetical protein
MTAETKEGTQREGLGAVGETGLVEGWSGEGEELFEVGEDTGGVFFKADGGVLSRRKARSDLSSITHSTVSPRANSMA